MRKKLGKSIFVFVLALLMVSSLALAAVDFSNGAKGAGVTANGDDPVYSGTAAGTDNATGGIITNLSLSTTSATTKWQGYVGSVSATLKVGSGSSVLYNFGSVPTAQILGVYASTASNFDFSVVELASVTDADSTWGFTASQADSITSTMSDTSGTLSTTGNNLVSLASVNLTSYEGGYQIVNRSITYLVEDVNGAVAKGDFAFATNVMDAGQTDYSNTTNVDYQLLVPVGNSEGVETYYFFMDIQ